MTPAQFPLIALTNFKKRNFSIQALLPPEQFSHVPTRILWKLLMKGYKRHLAFLSHQNAWKGSTTTRSKLSVFHG